MQNIPSPPSKTPHDAFFKALCTDVNIATDVMKHALPPELFHKIDLGSLALTDKSFISKNLRRIESDLIFKALINGHEGYICVIMEHQSTADPLLAFRKLEYTVALMRQHLKQKHDKLPVIINICLYHGETSPYPHSTDLFDCFAEPELAKTWMFKPFHLIDLTVIPDEHITQQGKAALLEYLFKHCRDAELSRNIKAVVALLKRISLEDYFDNMLHYLTYACGDQDNVDQLLHAIIQELPEKELKIMTYGQQLIQRGMQQGMQQGIQQGIQQGVEQGIQQGLYQGIQQEKEILAKKMLLKGRPINEITDFTDLPLSKIKKIKATLPH